MHGVAELIPKMRKLKDKWRIRYVGAATSRDEPYQERLAALRRRAGEWKRIGIHSIPEIPRAWMSEVPCSMNVVAIFIALSFGISLQDTGSLDPCCAHAIRPGTARVIFADHAQECGTSIVHLAHGVTLESLHQDDFLLG